MDPNVIWSFERRLTRRGVLWLGLKCDVRCKFCYDENLAAVKKSWINFDKACQMLKKYRYFYENRFVDFMGGEPTLHPDIIAIIEYSSSIGLLPTCVTHGMHLDQPKVVSQFVSAGIHDFLVSVHGVGESARKIHGVNYDTAKRQQRALECISEAGIPIRFNVTMIRDNVHQLSDIVRLCAKYGGQVINFLTFNPYFEWSSVEEISFQARHSEIAPHLMDAIDVCNENGIEANVRYMPFCLLPGYEKHVYTGYQLPYDPHEWDYNSWYDKNSKGKQTPEWYFAASTDQQKRHNYSQPDTCKSCRVRLICDGLHSQYAIKWGSDELGPLDGPVIHDPAYFVRQQRKLVYLEDGEEADSASLSTNFRGGLGHGAATNSGQNSSS